jgi:hypothetical protein
VATPPGFIVRNAAEAGSALDLAEPDALDFNLLSRHRFGVLTGCDISLSGWNVTVTQGVAVVNDLLVAAGGQVTLPTSSQQPRFDLIGIDQGGSTVYIRGTASPNPVFPDYDDTVAVIAAVYVTPGQNPPDPVRDLTDKRRFLPQRYLSTVAGGDFLGSYTSSPGLSARYTVRADGRTEWMGDTRIFRSTDNAKTLNVEDNLDVLKKLTAESAEIDQSLIVHGDLTAANLLTGQGPPGALPGTTGDLYQDQQNGGLWSYEGGAWKRLSTVPIPAGFIMASLTTDVDDGWLALNGQTVDKPTSGGLWDKFPEWRLDANSMRLPNANGMFLRMGVPGTEGGSATVPVNIANMPPHKHIDADSGGSVTTQAGGEHYHTGTVGPGGDHDHSTDPAQGAHHHDVSDPGHFHEGADGGGGGGFIAAFWGGTRRLDGPFNDASHPVSVEIVQNTVPSPSHVTVIDGGTHQHFTNRVPPHGHPLTINPFNSQHTHGIPERTVGGGQPLSIIPPFLAVNYLIKT